jgi:DNA repair exonuclease SbcCD ATPase subunit
METNREQIYLEVDKLVTTFNKIEGKRDEVKISLKSAQKNLDNVKKTHKEDLRKYELNRKSVEVVKKIIERLSEKGIQKLENLLTYGLNTIFVDREYTVYIEIKERGDVKTAEMWLVETLESGVSRKCKLRTSVGGGVQVIVSLIIRIYFILVLGLRRIVFLDETFTEVADEYLPGLFDFIQNTIKELGFKYLLITHDTRFVDYSDKLYRITKGNPKEILKGS